MGSTPGILFDGKRIAASGGKDWMRMTPQQAKAKERQRVRSFLDDKRQEREDTISTASGYGDSADLLDIVTGGGKQYALGLLVQKAAELGTDNPLGQIAIGLLAPGALRKAKGAVKGELRAGRNASKYTSRLRPDVDPVPGQLHVEMPAMQKKVLSQDEQDAVKAIGKQFPAIGHVTDVMSPLEIRKSLLSSPEEVAGFDRLIRFLPHAEKMAAGMKAGEAKRGWYRASAQAILDVFGPEDAPRFASLLAAMSPRVSVEGNLLNAMNTWTNWIQAGRPTGRDAILNVMAGSVQGGKGLVSVMEGWRDNAVTALSHPNPLATISGPKVDSFRKNLLDEVYAVTNDAWNSNALRMNQNYLSGTRPNLPKGDPGIGHGYGAMSAAIRKASNVLGYTPAEGQETLWSFAKPLMEKAENTGMSARDLLQGGHITPKDIKGTVDFSTLFKTGEYGNILRRGGYGPQLDAMKSYKWPKTDPSFSSADQRYMEEFAGTLDELSGTRSRESRSGSTAKPDAPTVFGYRASNPVFSPGMQGKVENTLLDPRGHNLFDAALHGDTMVTRPSAGGAASGFETSIFRDEAGRPSFIPETEKAIRAAHMGQGLLTQQPRQVTTAIAPDPQGASYFVPRPGKAGTQMSQGIEDAVKEAMPRMQLEDSGFGILASGGASMPRKKADILQGLLEIPKKPKEGYLATPLRVETDFSKEFRKQGTGKSSSLLLEAADALDPNQRQGFENALREASGQAEGVYQRAKEPQRLDVMNLIGMLKHPDGLERVRQGLKSKAFLPTAAAAAYLGSLNEEE
jgi:uncharacterized membrane protein